MIVVVGALGTPALRSLAAAIAGRGGRCEVVGKASPDATGDRLLRELASAGIGHAAVLRTPAVDLEAADLDLALRYLPEARVIILVGADDLASVASAASAWAGATLIVVMGGGVPLAALPSGERSIVLAAPGRDPDAAFAGVVADLALRLDGGEPLGRAWPSTLAALGAEAVSGGASAPAGAGSPGPARAAAPAPARPGPDRRSGRR